MNIQEKHIKNLHKKYCLIFFLFLLILMQGYKAVGQKNAIDEIVAVVGKNIVLKSEIEAQYAQYRIDNRISESEQAITCRILEGMLFQKLLIHQGELDSIQVSSEQIDRTLDMRLQYYITQIGSEEKLEEYYGKSIEKIKEEMYELIYDQYVADQVKQKIIAKTTITPSEVRSFYEKFPGDSIPLIESTVEMGQIVKVPPISEEVKQEVKDRLNTIKKRIENGESFETLAILYSEDPGSAKNGGELGLTKRGSWYPEFEGAAFKLKENQISDIVKTEAGFHIIQFIERRGDYVNVRHILLRLKPSPVDQEKAVAFLDSIADLVRKDSVDFEQAVIQFSEDPSRTNAGLVVNKASGSTMFLTSELDPGTSFALDKMEVNDISQAISFKTNDGKDAFRLVYLKKRTAPHHANLKEDYDQIQQWALNAKNQSIVNKWIQERLEKTYVRLSKEYQSCDFESKWL